ncbi:MAG: DUF2878 domain-containing protein [Pseudomonadota bacterium]
MRAPGSYSRLLNFAWYQLLWFTAVLGTTQALPVLFLLVIPHLLLVRNRGSELALMAGTAVLGTLFDASLTLAGYYQFAASDGGLPFPVWLPLIWIGFAGTLRHSMAFMVARPKLMTFAATVFAPLTYLAAQRLGAVSFPHGSIATALVIGLSWWVITPLLLRLEVLTRHPETLWRQLFPCPRHRTEV